MKRFCILPGLLCTAQLFAASGVVRTLDTNSISGEIKFTPQGIQVSNAAQQTSVPLTNLLRLQVSSTTRAASTNSAGKGTGLLGIYYPETNLTGSAYVRLDESVNFFWNPKDQPARDIDGDYFSATWVGEVEAPVAGDYSFFISTDDGGRLFLKNQYMIERWQRQEIGDTSMTLTLKAGERVPVRVDAFNASGPARAKLSWSGPGLKKTLIPKERLFPSANFPGHTVQITQATNGLLATFYAKPDLTGSTFSRIDTTLNFEAKEDSAPGSGISATNYSVRWNGRVKADFTEPCTLHLSVDEGARLAVNGVLLADHWTTNEPHVIERQVPMVAGEFYDLDVELRNTGGLASARLEWSSPSVPKALIPADHLFPSKPPARGPQTDATLFTPPGLALRNGGFVGAEVTRATETQISVAGALQRVTFSTVNVATILCQPMSQKLAAKIPPGRTGVLLMNGDFVESEFRSLEAGTAQVSSVLFGIRKFDVKKEVVAIILRDARPPSWTWSIELADQTRIFANSIALGAEGLTLLDPSFSNFRVPALQVIDIRRNTGFTSFAQALALY